MRDAGGGPANDVGARRTSIALALMGATACLMAPAPPAAASPTRHERCLLQVSTPYTEAHPLRFTLSLALNSTGSQYLASVPFGGIEVRDARWVNHPWTLRLVSSELRAVTSTPNTDGAINDQNVGLVDLRPSTSPGSTFDTSPHNLTIVDRPPPAVAASENARGQQGLGGTPHVIATARHGRGAVGLNGTLQVVAPTSTPPGSYAGRLVFSVGCSRVVVPVGPPRHHHPTHHHHHPPHRPPKTSGGGGIKGGGHSSGSSSSTPSTSGGRLAFTGFPAAMLAVAGALALLDGGVLVWLGRRRGLIRLKRA